MLNICSKPKHKPGTQDIIKGIYNIKFDYNWLNICETKIPLIKNDLLNIKNSITGIRDTTKITEHNIGICFSAVHY